MRHCEELHPLQCWYSLSFCAILWQSTFVVCLCWYALLQPATKLYCGRSSRRGIGAGCIPYCLGCPSSGWRVYLVFSHLPLTAPHRSTGIKNNTRVALVVCGVWWVFADPQVVDSIRDCWSDLTSLSLVLPCGAKAKYAQTGINAHLPFYGVVTKQVWTTT